MSRILTLLDILTTSLLKRSHVSNIIKFKLHTFDYIPLLKGQYPYVFLVMFRFPLEMDNAYGYICANSHLHLFLKARNMLDTVWTRWRSNAPALKV